MPGWYLGLAGVLMMALAPDWRWAAPAFFVYGISAIAIPVTNLYITHAIDHDPTRRPDLPIQTSLTLMWAAYSLGLVITPAIGGWIGDHVGLRTVFLLSALWFVLSTFAISRTHMYPTPKRPKHGYNYRGLLTQRRVMAALGVLMIGFAAVLTGQTLSSQFLEEVRHFSPTTIGVFGSVSALGTAVSSILLGRLTAWRGFFCGLAMVMTAFGLLLLSGAPGVVVIGMFLLGAHYTTRPLANSVISAYVSEHQRGMAYGLVDTLAGLATVIGTNAAGSLYDYNPQGPFITAMIGIIVVAALGVWLIAPGHRNAHVPAAYSVVEPTGD